MISSSTRPQVGLDDNLATDALRHATPIQQLVLERPHLGSEEVRTSLGGTGTGRDVSKQEVARLRSQGTLIGVRCGRHGFLYPAFQLDTVNRLVVPAVAKINRILRRTLTLEETLRWWCEPTDAHGTPRHERVAVAPDQLTHQANHRSIT